MMECEISVCRRTFTFHQEGTLPAVVVASDVHSRRRQRRRKAQVFGGKTVCFHMWPTVEGVSARAERRRRVKWIASKEKWKYFAFPHTSRKVLLDERSATLSFGKASSEATLVKKKSSFCCHILNPVNPELIPGEVCSEPISEYFGRPDHYQPL